MTLGLVAGYLALLWIVSRVVPNAITFHLHEHFAATVYSLGSLLFGGQLLSIGFLAEMITARINADQETYCVSQRVGREMKNEK